VWTGFFSPETIRTLLINDVAAGRRRGSVHHYFIKPLESFFALFSARFSLKLFCGSFLVCFFLSMPLLMMLTPHLDDWSIVYGATIACRTTGLKPSFSRTTRKARA
jgi:hypothetical protein